MKKEIVLNGEAVDVESYYEFHQRRINFILHKLRAIGARNVIEVGGHPWVMASSILDDIKLKLSATISAEEVTFWPEDIGVDKREYTIRTFSGNEYKFVNYSANIERTLFDIDEKPDTILASEIIEHLIRAPHIMLLNFNHWLPKGGKLIITTPNGAHFFNPFRRRSLSPQYRANVYERHFYLYTLEDLINLVVLSGFKILESGYANFYRYKWLSNIYRILSWIPGRYFKDKFKRTLYVIAEKEKEVKELEDIPSVYDHRGNWEYVKRQMA